MGCDLYFRSLLAGMSLYLVPSMCSQSFGVGNISPGKFTFACNYVPLNSIIWKKRDLYTIHLVADEVGWVFVKPFPSWAN